MLVATAGAVVAFCFVGSVWLTLAGIDTPSNPPTWPALPLVPVLGLIIAATPAFTAPMLPRDTRVAVSKNTVEVGT